MENVSCKLPPKKKMGYLCSTLLDKRNRELIFGGISCHNRLLYEVIIISLCDPKNNEEMKAINEFKAIAQDFQQSQDQDTTFVHFPVELRNNESLPPEIALDLSKSLERLEIQYLVISSPGEDVVRLQEVISSHPAKLVVTHGMSQLNHQIKGIDYIISGEIEIDRKCLLLPHTHMFVNTETIHPHLRNSGTFMFEEKRTFTLHAHFPIPRSFINSYAGQIVANLEINTQNICFEVAGYNFWRGEILNLSSNEDKLSAPHQDFIVTSRYAYQIPEGVPVLANFSEEDYISDEVIKSWIQVLKDSPTSVMWLRGTESRRIEKICTFQAELEGVDVKRIIFSYNLMCSDIMLRLGDIITVFADTFSKNDTLNCCFALAGGTLCVTLEGSTPESRETAGVLTSINMKTLVCKNQKEYELKLMLLLKNQSHITDSLKKALHQRIISYLPPFGPPLAVAHMEELLEQVEVNSNGRNTVPVSTMALEENVAILASIEDCLSLEDLCCDFFRIEIAPQNESGEKSSKECLQCYFTDHEVQLINQPKVGESWKIYCEDQKTFNVAYLEDTALNVLKSLRDLICKENAKIIWKSIVFKFVMCFKDYLADGIPKLPESQEEYHAFFSKNKFCRRSETMAFLIAQHVAAPESTYFANRNLPENELFLNIDTAEKSSLSKSNALICPLCAAHNLSLWKLLHCHIKQHAIRRNISCKSCGRLFETDEELKIHMDNKHVADHEILWNESHGTRLKWEPKRRAIILTGELNSEIDHYNLMQGLTPDETVFNIGQELLTFVHLEKAILQTLLHLKRNVAGVSATGLAAYQFLKVLEANLSSSEFPILPSLKAKTYLKLCFPTVRRPEGFYFHSLDQIKFFFSGFRRTSDGQYKVTPETVSLNGGSLPDQCFGCDSRVLKKKTSHFSSHLYSSSTLSEIVCKKCGGTFFDVSLDRDSHLAMHAETDTFQWVESYSRQNKVCQSILDIFASHNMNIAER